MTDFFERKKNELGVDLNDVQKKAVLKRKGLCFYWHARVLGKQRR